MNFADFTARSDVGCVRSNNEDAFGAFSEFGVWCVADGMGGGDDGEIASSAVVRMIGNALQSAQTDAIKALQFDERLNILREAASDASQWVKERSSSFGLQSCGTTLVGVIVADDGRLAVFHVGDSRAYLLRGTNLKQLTRDHSLAAAMNVKEEKLPMQLRSTVLRAIGVESDVELEVSCNSWETGDLLLLCSDGLTRMVSDREIRKILTSSCDIDAVADRLIASARLSGGVDNITVVLVRFRAERQGNEKWLGGDCHDD